MNASNEKLCDSCRHQHRQDNYPPAWCYLFIKSPRTLPCGQHDKYEKLRKSNSARLLAEMTLRHET